MCCSVAPDGALSGGRGDTGIGVSAGGLSGCGAVDEVAAGGEQVGQVADTVGARVGAGFGKGVVKDCYRLGPGVSASGGKPDDDRTPVSGVWGADDQPGRLEPVNDPGRGAWGDPQLPGELLRGDPVLDDHVTQRQQFVNTQPEIVGEDHPESIHF